MKKDWDIEEIAELDKQPLFKLIATSHAIHCSYHQIGEIQVCSLISIKTGGCPENCKYCPQSAHYQTSVVAQPLMHLKDVIEQAKQAIDQGASRICLGAAWREVRDSTQFEQVLEMISEIKALGAEVCCTLGMLKEHQAAKLKEAGLYAYNHNLDTSEKFYSEIITSRNFSDRLKTLKIAGESGLTTCCGGILGLGESRLDRLSMLLTLSQLQPQPQSVPINQLIPICGTPLAEQPPISFWEFLRFVAIVRIVLPETMIRLSAGRQEFSLEQQTLCFFAGANSIHSGEKLLTVANKPIDQDAEMFAILGLTKRQAYRVSK